MLSLEVSITDFLQYCGALLVVPPFTYAKLPSLHAPFPEAGVSDFPLTRSAMSMMDSRGTGNVVRVCFGRRHPGRTGH